MVRHLRLSILNFVNCPAHRPIEGDGVLFRNAMHRQPFSLSDCDETRMQSAAYATPIVPLSDPKIHKCEHARSVPCLAL